ncbi:DUF6731 family protein [Paenibacillus ehimensis]|uniref:Uncharacterized protein n=1 Tax=Paenibacillus ehimensis TaxID=79264 RepID=A0ABT8VI37_9BACL|nr:DUF6731 family protein [Paenibacillus ehimensis]MDO3680654.1 hypothetical protein [Paenibacillus ehimensis]
MYRKVRFEYYQVVFRTKDDSKHDRDRLFDLVQWMDKAKKKSLEGRTYNYRQEQARLEDAYWDQELGFYFLHLVRLRDTNIPSKARVDSSVEPLELEDDEFIGEEVSALYDENNHVLMLQRNKFSLGPEGIEEYLNLLWDNDDETIHLRPICPPNAFAIARKASEYRKINIRFADIKDVDSKKLLHFKSPLKGIISSYNEYRGLNAQVIITVGNVKSSSLDNKTINDTLDDLEENPQFFSKAEITKRDSDDARVEILDLFAHKAHDFGTFRMEKRETLSHYAIAEEMWSIYSGNEECSNRQKDINSYLR